MAIEQTVNTDVDGIIEQLGCQDFDLIDSPSYISPANGIIPWQEIVNEEKESNEISESDDDDDEMHPSLNLKLSFAQAQISLSALALYFENHGMTKESVDMYNALSNLGKGEPSHFKQKLITDFINK